ncbi:MAG: hypothetical protein KJO07_15740, partial [Deltaproteobacteria bacterium]|nr:hypothetical protein [Deltaproteobacteria bacterium]
TDVEVHDEFGELVLRADKATGEIETLALALGPDFHFRNIVVHEVPRKDGKPSAYALIREVRQSVPEYEGDRTVVSLVSAFFPKPSPSFRAGMSATVSPVFDLRSFEVRGVSIDFDFGEVFRAQTRGVSGKGFLRSDPRDPLSRKLYYSLSPTAKEASIQSGPVQLEVRDLDVERLAQIAEEWPRSGEPTSLRWAARGRTLDGVGIVLEGGMLDHWSSFYGGDYDIRLDLDNAGTIAGSLSNQLAGGSKVSAVVKVGGPRVAPTLQVSTRNLELSPMLGDKLIPVTLATAHAQFDLATDSGSLSDTVASVGGGQVQLKARLSLNPISFDVDLDIPEPVDISVVGLPPELTRLTGAPLLKGSMHASGTRDLWELDQLDLELGRLGITGRVYRRLIDGVVEVQRLGLTLGRTHVDVTGNLYTEDGVYDLSVNGSSRDLSRWLRTFRVPALATSAGGNAHITGTFKNPTITAALTARGVPLVDQASTRLSYRGGDLQVSSIQSKAFGGSLKGQARIRLGGRPYIVSAKAAGERLDLSKLPIIGGGLTGQATLALDASGPTRAPRAQLDLDLENWTLVGERYQDTRLVARSEEDGSQSVEAHLVREKGGKLDLAAFLGKRGDLGGVVSMRKLPLETLTQLGDAKQPIFGAAVDAELQLSGTAKRPTADGHVSLTESWFGKTFLGGASLDLV